jgi:outer membrane protein assembly factor BamB
LLFVFASLIIHAAGILDPHTTVLSTYTLPATAAADGDLSEWRGVPAVGPDQFHYLGQNKLIKYDDDFTPYFYAGRVPDKPDLYFLVVVKDRCVNSFESAGWINGDSMEIFLDFGRDKREASGAKWWEGKTWNYAPEMSQYGFMPYTMNGEGKIFKSGISKDWKVDYVSVPIEGGVAYEVRIDGKSVLDNLKMTALPPVIGLDIHLTAVDYPVLRDGGGWSNFRGFMVLFSDWSAIVNPNTYGGLSTKPLPTPAGDIPAKPLPALYSKNPTLKEMKASWGKIDEVKFADLLYWASCQGVKLDLSLVKQCMNAKSPLLRETCLQVLSGTRQKDELRKLAVLTAFAKSGQQTTRALIYANLITEQLGIAGQGTALTAQLSNPDLNIAFAAANALAKTGNKTDLDNFTRVYNEKLLADKEHANAIRVFMQPALDMMAFRLNPPPLPKATPTNTVLAQNTDLTRVMPVDNNNVYNGKGLLRSWPKDGPRECWQYEVGNGMGAVVESDGRAFVLGRKDGKQYAYCIDAVKGTLLWQHELVARDGGFCVSSPLIDGNQIYFIAEGAVVCLNTADGKEIWREDKEYSGTQFTSGLIIGENLYIPQKSLTAVDKMTGKVRWRTTGPNVSPASLAYQILDGIPQIIIPVGSGKDAEVWGVNANDGTIYWKFPVKIGYGLCVSPVVDGSRVYLSSGEPGQEFFIALQMYIKDGKIQPAPVYIRKDTQANKANTVAIYNNAVYGFWNRRLDCTDASDGKLLWSEKNNGWDYDQQLIIADGLIFAISGKDLVLVDANTKGYKELGRIKIPIKTSQQQPTIANGRLYLRGETKIICYGVK